jgi:hypothetical protein
LAEVKMTEVAVKSDPPSGPTKNLVAKLNAYRNVILAVAALATAVGSWFRPTDTSATKTTFDWTSKKIEELSANDIKIQQDMVAMRNFLEGYMKAQNQLAQASTGVGVGLGPVGAVGHSAGSSRPAGGARKPARKPAAPPAMDVAPDAPSFMMEETAAPEAMPERPVPELPVLNSAPELVKKPSFEDVVKQ